MVFSHDHTTEKKGYSIYYENDGRLNALYQNIEQGGLKLIDVELTGQGKH